MEIKKGKLASPLKVLVYGPEGIGKTTFAAKFPGAVFADTEGSTKHYSVARFSSYINSWEELLESVTYTAAHPDEVGTYVLDTADWADRLCADYVCRQHSVKGIEDIGYGKGYTYLEEEYRKILTYLERLLMKGVNVVVTAHAAITKFEQPDEAGSYSRWELKCSKKVSPLLKEWADIMLFANYKTVVYEDSKTKNKKATGGKRVMYSAHHPCWDAKNRFGLPEEMDLDYECIAHLIRDFRKKDVSDGYRAETVPKEEKKEEEPKKEKKGEKKEKERPTGFAKKVADSRKASIMAEKIPDRLKELMIEADLIPWDVQEAVAHAGYYDASTPMGDYAPEFIEGCLIGAWGKVADLARRLRDGEEEIPF